MATDDRQTPGAGEPATEEVAAIPLVEERLSVSKRQVEKGRVRVHVSVEEREETISLKLSHDDVQIKHVPKNVRITEMPNVRLEGSTTIVPIVEEVFVIEKALMLVEEIHIQRHTASENVDVPVTRRREYATIERDSGAETGARARSDVP